VCTPLGFTRTRRSIIDRCRSRFSLRCQMNNPRFGKGTSFFKYSTEVDSLRNLDERNLIYVVPPIIVRRVRNIRKSVFRMSLLVIAVSVGILYYHLVWYTILIVVVFVLYFMRTFLRTKEAWHRIVWKAFDNNDGTISFQVRSFFRQKSRELSLNLNTLSKVGYKKPLLSLGISGFIVRIYEDGIVNKDIFMNLIRKSSSLQKRERNVQFQENEKARDDEEDEGDEGDEGDGEGEEETERPQQQRKQQFSAEDISQIQKLQQRQQQASTRQGKKEDTTDSKNPQKSKSN